MAKQSKDENSNTKKHKKKKNKAGPNAIAMKSKAPKPNPFETIWSRRKFDILGKKRKGEEKRIGLARSIAIEKRKKTLLKEYEQSGKSSVFLDKRIGEQNDDLGEFDKAILRSQRERQLKQSKKSKYNLSDGEEDEFGLEGVGSLPERDDFEDEIPFDDDDDVDATYSGKGLTILKQLSAHHSLTATDTGLMEGDENRKKTKKEVMEEIMLKSKFFKAQKAKDKEESEQMVEQLDKDFTSLVQSKALLSLTQPDKMNALKALVNKSFSNDNVKKGEIFAVHNSREQEKPDSYDKLVKEMGLDIRARPSNRTKTPEEIAQEEKERLEELEEERQKRMLGTDDGEDGDASEGDDNVPAQKLRSISGDDLGDSFSHDEDRQTKRTWADLIREREKENDLENEEDGASSEDSESAEEDAGDEGSDDEDDEDEDEDEDKTEKIQSLKDWEQSDDDDLGTDLEDEEDKEEEDEDDIGDEEIKTKGHKKELGKEQRQTDSLGAEKTKASGKPLSVQQEDLPFVIEAPKSLEELSSLLENRSDKQIVEAIRRIRTCNAISIAADNRKKMQVFYGVLLQYFAVSANKKPLNFKLLNLLVKPLMEMSVELPYFAAICARQRLLRTRTLFCEDVKNPEKSSWPSVKTLFLLRLWSMIFPCSDFRHAVMTPAILLMCEYLMRCRILCGRDIAIGSFLCSMVLSVIKQSRKFCPETITFLQTLLIAAMDRKPGQSPNSQLNHLMEIKAPKPLLCIQSHVNEIIPLDFLMLMNMSEDSPFFSSDNFRASMLVSVVETLRGFVQVYEGFSSFPEMFSPVRKVLLELAEQEHIPVSLQDKIRDVAQLIEKKAQEHHMLRRPLQMRKQKPVPIKLLNPKFEENFVKGRDYDPDRERAEKRKLKKLVKREAKGAARELRKDNYFLFEAKEKDRARLEEERSERYGKARAFLQEQEHAFKSGQLGKGTKRRR